MQGLCVRGQRANILYSGLTISITLLVDSEERTSEISVLVWHGESTTAGKEGASSFADLPLEKFGWAHYFVSGLCAGNEADL